MTIALEETERIRLQAFVGQGPGKYPSLARAIIGRALACADSVMRLEEVAEHQEKIIKDLSGDLDIWVFGGAGSALPFPNRPELQKLWKNRLEAGISHHVFWNLDLADYSTMNAFIRRTAQVCAELAELQSEKKPSSASGKVFHYGVAHGKTSEENVFRYREFDAEIKDASLEGYCVINDVVDLAREGVSDSLKRQARWLCRYGEMGSLVFVLPRKIGTQATGCHLNDKMRLRPDSEPQDVWLWLSDAECDDLRNHIKTFSRSLQNHLRPAKTS